MVRQERLQNGGVRTTALANFRARIVRDIVFDDGEGPARHFGIEAELGGNKLAFSVTAAEFPRMA